MSLSALIKGRAQCHAPMHSNFHKYLWNNDVGMQGRLYYTNFQYTNTCACVESPHYLACFVVCFPTVI